MERENSLRGGRQPEAAWGRWAQRKYELLLILAGIVFALQATLSILYVRTWDDEANYLYDSWLIVARGWTPYHDTFVRLGPVLYYVYGIFQRFFGPSFYVGRLESVILTGLTLLILFQISRKLGGKWAGVATVWLLVSNNYVMGLFSSAVPYALTSFFIASSLGVLVFASNKFIRIVGSLTMMSLAFLTRQDMAPALILLLAYIIWTEREKKTIAVALATTFFVPLLVLAPFLLKDFEATVFQVFTYHPPAQFLGTGPILSTGLRTGGYLRRHLISFFEIAAPYFLIFQVMFATLLMVLVRRRKQRGELRGYIEENKILLLLVSIFIALFLLEFSRITFVVPALLYPIPLAAVVAGVVIAMAYSQLDSDRARDFLLLLLVSGIVLSAIAMPPRLSLPGEESDVQRIQRAAKVIEQYTSPYDKIFTLDQAHHVFLAGREVLSPLNMGMVLYTPLTDRQRVEKYHFFNQEMVAEWLSREADAVLINRERDYLKLYAEGDKLREVVDTKLKENYRLVATMEKVYPRAYAATAKDLQLYLRKEKTP